jgi:hypothetical protein
MLEWFDWVHPILPSWYLFVASHLALRYYSFPLDLIQVQAQAQVQVQAQALALAQDQVLVPSLVQAHVALTSLLAAGSHYPHQEWVNGVQGKASVAFYARLPAAPHGVASAEVSSFHQALWHLVSKKGKFVLSESEVWKYENPCFVGKWVHKTQQTGYGRNYLCMFEKYKNIKEKAY